MLIIKILIFALPYFQLVRSKHRRYGGFSGNKLNINFEIIFVSTMKLAKNLWMRRSFDSTIALPSNPWASLLKQTVCTLHNAMMKETKNFTLALFHPNRDWKMSTNSLLLIEALFVIHLKFLVVHKSKIMIFRALSTHV